MITVTWTYDSMTDAAARHEFIMVSPYGASRVNITDSQSLWMKNPEIVFQTNYRIAGTPQDITSDLTSQEISSSDIQALLDSSITNTNYGNVFAPVYQKEVDNYLKYQRGSVFANANSDGVKLLDILMTVNPNFTDKFKTQSEARAMGVSIRKPRVTQSADGSASFARRVAGLEEGKVMDVSNLEPDGKGARTIASTTATKQQKYGTQTLKIVSYDFPHYELAISMLPDGQVQYQAELTAMRNFYTGNPPAITTTIPALVVPPPPIISPRNIGLGPIVRDPVLPRPPVETVAPLFTKAQKKRMAAARAVTAVPPPPAIIPTAYEDLSSEDEDD